MNIPRNSAAPRLPLGRKLLLVILTFTGLFAANFIAYNYLLRELDRTAAAVDAAGRQRMLSQKIAYMAFQVSAGHAGDRGTIMELTREFDETLEAFESGGFSRTFPVRPAPAGTAALVRVQKREWQPFKAAASAVSRAPAGRPELKDALSYIEAHSESLLSACEAVTAAFRGTAKAATSAMNQLILLLISLELLFGAAVYHIAKKKITAPLVILDRAAAEITSGKFPVLEAETSDDEVGNLFKTFSVMSGTIGRDVQKNYAIGGLLAISMEHGSMSELLGRFLDNLLATPWLDIEPRGAIFLADAGGKNLVLAASRGVPDGAGGACADLPVASCLCAEAAATGETVFTPSPGAGHKIAGMEAKLHGHYCFPVKAGNKVVGVLNLYVSEGHKYDESERAFLEAACSIIAKAIEYKSLEAKAYQAQKMESLGKAAGAIAHDFNNILTVAQGFNALAQDTLPAGSEAERFVRETGSGLEKGAALVKQILAFSRKQPAEMSSLDLNEVVAGVQAMLGVVLEKKVNIKLALGPGLPHIMANKGQLEQVLVNLAVNARDAMEPGGGEFSITTAAVSDESALSCAAELHGVERVVRLSVSDTGCGMPAEVIEHIYEPFFTTKPEGQGTGLGLATVYSIVQLHKGGINITSRPGQGTTFDICFPADSARA